MRRLVRILRLLSMAVSLALAATAMTAVPGGPVVLDAAPAAAAEPLPYTAGPPTPNSVIIESNRVWFTKPGQTKAGTDGLINCGWTQYLEVEDRGDVGKYRRLAYENGELVQTLVLRSFRDSLVSSSSISGAVPVYDSLVAPPGFRLSFINGAGLGCDTKPRDFPDVASYVAAQEASAAETTFEVWYDGPDRLDARLKVEDTLEFAAVAGHALYSFDGSASRAPSGDPIVEYFFDFDSISEFENGPDVRGSQSAIRRDTLRTTRERSVTLTVTTASGLTDSDTVTFTPTGDAVSFDADARPTPRPGATELLTVDVADVQHTLPNSARGELSISWTGPDLSAFAVPDSVTGTHGPSATGVTPSDSVGPPAPGTFDAMDATWVYTPTVAGVYEATVRVIFEDETTGEIQTAFDEIRGVEIIGADVRAVLEPRVTDPDDPARLAPDETREFDLTLINDGFGPARIDDISLVRPVDGLTIDFVDAPDPADEIAADGGSVVVKVRLSVDSAGDYEIPLKVTVRDASTGSTRNTIHPEVRAFVSAFGGFEWSVPDRIERPAPGEVPDLPDTTGEAGDVQHDEYPVDIRLTATSECDEAIVFKVDGSVVATEQSLEDPCEFRLLFEEEGDYTVSVELYGEEITAGEVTVEDILWVVIGDSVASGEGNPDIPGSAGLGGIGWVDEGCSRSANSGAVQAAYEWEERSDKSSVTLVHLACSGATIANGLLGPQVANPFYDAEDGPDQLALLQSLVGDREVDVVLLSIGGNDMLFGPATRFCIFNGSETAPCQYLGFSEVTDVQVGNTSVAGNIPAPEVLTPFTGALCSDAPQGTSVIWVEGQGDIGDPAGWRVTVNAAATDFTERIPLDNDSGPILDLVGPKKSESFDVASTGTTSCPSDVFKRLAGFSGTSLKLTIDGTLAQSHYSGYVPPVNPLSSQPSEERVVVSPPTLEDAVDESRARYESNLARLDQRFTELGIDPTAIYALEYYDPTTDVDGQTCETILGINTGAGGFFVNRAESSWAARDIVGRLNQTLAATRSRFGWNVVGGPGTAFIGRGYCTPVGVSAVVNSTIATFADQGNLSGLLHPNNIGHGILEDYIFAAVDGRIQDPSEVVGSDPTAKTQLLQAVQAGENVLRLAAAVGESLEQLSLSTDASDSPVFAVGDWLVIGDDSGATAGRVVPLGPAEVVEVVEVTATGVVVEPAVEFDHLAGESVTRVTDRSLVEDPYVPTVVLPGVEFSDVGPGEWFSDAVSWAAGERITMGLGDGRFGPFEDLDRAQLVTMVWRAAGSPVVSSGVPFTDVNLDGYYGPALRWAYANGIVKGTSSTTFEPDAAATRGQIVAVLWRWSGRPVPVGPNPFNDTAPGRYFTVPAAWAEGEQVTTGLPGGRFGPDQGADRATLVTMLHRLLT
jgi:lysophospholipase L1-like esterase